MRTADPSRTAERRRQILDAALACFQEKGFHGAAMSAICKKAKMSPGHLYHYFSSKEDLIEAISEEDSENAVEKIGEVLESDNAFQALLNKTSAIWDKEGRSIHGALNAEIMAEATRNPRIAAIVHARQKRIHARINEVLMTAQEQGQIDPDIDTSSFACIVFGLASGLILSAEVNPDFDRQRATESFRLTLQRTLQRKLS